MSEATLKKYLALGLAAFALAAGIAHAQPSWTFDRVLGASLANHPSIQGKRFEQAAALADKEGARWALYPTPYFEATTRSEAGANNGLLRIDQPLWTGGRITAGIDAAGSRYDAATAGIDEARLDMTLRVISAYTEAVRQKDRERYATESVAEHEKLLAMIRRRVAGDVSSRTDERLAETRLFQATNDLSLTSQALSNAFTQLSQLSGATVADIVEQGLDDTKMDASLEKVLDSALAASPTLQRLRHEEEAAIADIDSKRSAYMPQLTLRLERSVGGRDADSRAMVVLQAQPGAGLSAGAGVNAAIARREAIRQAQGAAERDVRQRVTLDWNELSAARLRLEAARRSSAISNEVFESYTRQYVIGRKSWIDVLNAVRETVQSRFTLADARAQTIAAGLRLQAQTGALKRND